MAEARRGAPTARLNALGDRVPPWRAARKGLLVLLSASLLTGCVLAPRGADQERRKVALAGEAFEPQRDERSLPELPLEPGWRELLRHAFLANGDLEAAYFDWKAAVSRIDVAAAYPNTNVSFGISYLFSDENMKAWNRTTLNVGFDPMQNLSFPTKVLAAGRIALAEAKAAAARFAAMKFDLQRQVLTAYFDFALLAEKRRLQETDVGLQRLIATTAARRVEAGAAQQGLLDAEVRLRLAENDLSTLDADLARQRATLNALVGRPADALLVPPAQLPPPRPLPVDDARLSAIAVDDNPVLAALAHEVDGRRSAVSLARQQYIPDFNPFAGFTGSIEQVVGIAISIPATIPRVRAGIADARTMLRASEARAAQAGLDRAARFAAALAALRDSERQSTLFETEIVPAAELAAIGAEQGYSTEARTLADLVEARRLLLDIRRFIAEARAMRERQLAELEALAGVDFETLGGSTHLDGSATGKGSAS